MKRNLILTIMLLLTLAICGQSSIKQRAAGRRASLRGTATAVQQPSASAEPPTTQAVAAVISSPIRLEWIEFLTPQAAALSELYTVATGFARGSYEFCEIVALSGRLFPTDPAACINAAGVALLRGDAATARQYLQRLMFDQRAFNNVGLLYLLEGNRDKAEVYLQLATANGNCPAAAALK